MGSSNYIIAKINIGENEIDKDIRIINSFEEVKRQYRIEDKEDDYKFENEKEIKDKCIIKINDKKIPFNYYNKFNEKGKYKIEYLFNGILTKTDYMFFECNYLKNINLSNFNTKNVTNMSYMFCECNSLSNINLTNFNTQNVINMRYMFSRCYSLSNIDLSNFNTKNVKNMSYMFYECLSLQSLNFLILTLGTLKI